MEGKCQAWIKRMNVAQVSLWNVKCLTPPSSTTSTSLFIIMISKHCWDSHYRWLMELSFWIHANVSFGVFNSNPFIDLSHESRFEWFQTNHFEFHQLWIVCNLAVFPQWVFISLLFQPSDLFKATSEAIVAWLAIIMSGFSSLGALFTLYPISNWALAAVSSTTTRAREAIFSWYQLDIIRWCKNI